MSNPFEESKFVYGEYRQHIRDQISDFKLAQCEILDYGDEPMSKVRMTVSKVSKELGRKFSIKTARNGAVWIKRTK